MEEQAVAEYDYNELLEFVSKKTGVDVDTCENVLTAEDEFLEALGLVYTVDE